MAIKDTFSFILLVMIPVAMMAKQPFMSKGNVQAFTTAKAIVQTKGKCNVTEIKEQIEAIKRQLDGLSTELESCQQKACCPDGWLRYRCSCYYIDDTPTTKQAMARTTCQNMGADLPTIRSAAENNFILNLMMNQRTVTSRGVWLGMHRSAVVSRFQWVDGTPLERGQYQNWAANEPNNRWNTEHCGHMYPQSPGQWNDVPCDLSSVKNNVPVILCQIRLPDCTPA